VKQMKENRITVVTRKPGPMKMGWQGHVSNWLSGETALAKHQGWSLPPRDERLPGSGKAVRCPDESFWCV
jgi:hypothetical protein